jgi:hypothetical protein
MSHSQTAVLPTERRGVGQLLTTRPTTYWQQVANSALVWLVLMAYWGLVSVILTFSPAPASGRQIPPTDFLTHAVYTVAGLVGILFAHKTGFPAAWDARIPLKSRFLLPTLLGIGLGILSSAVDAITGASKILEGVLGQPFNVAFPHSLLTSTSQAAQFEVTFLRLLGIPLLLWLISSVMLKGRAQERVFWVLAAITSAIEPFVIQGIPLLILSGGLITPAAFAGYAVVSYALNFGQATFFRKYGLLAAVLLRVVYYLVWHVIYGNFLIS